MRIFLNIALVPSSERELCESLKGDPSYWFYIKLGQFSDVIDKPKRIM